MAKQIQPKKVLMLQGSIIEIGQALTNLYGLNPEIVVHQTINTLGIREKPSTGLLTPQLTQQVEQVVVLYIIYSNPGDLVGFSVPQAEEQGPVKAKFPN